VIDMSTVGGVVNVTADRCSHRWRIEITPLNTGDTWRYTVDEAKTQAKAHQEELACDAEASRQ
jgi:hypothetical protein